ncbi:MAG: MFS transporter [Burkholderiales bacterium]
MSASPFPSPSSAEITSLLRLAGLAGFCSMASMRMCDPMLVALGAEFHRSTGEASRVVSAFAVTYGLMQLLYGPLGDRIGKLNVVGLAAAGCTLASALAALAPSFDLLVVCRALMGAMAAGIIPMSLAWIGDQVPYERRQETLARLMGATLTGMLSGQWLGGVAADTIGWRGAFWVLALAFGVAAWRLRRGARELPTQVAAGGVGTSLATALSLLRQPQVRWVLAVTLTEGALVFGVVAFVPSHLAEHFGFSLSAAGAVMALYGVGGLCYSQLARLWVRVLGERGLSGVGSVLIAASMLALGHTDLRAVAVGACFLAGLGFYMLHSTLQTQASQMAPQARGTGVALFACVLFFGQSIGVPLAAAGIDRGLASFTFTIAAMATLLLGMTVARRVGRPPKPTAS